MRTLRRLLGSRANAVVMAVLALALQAGSSGYVQACPMKMKTAMSATHACCGAAQACHMPVKTARKACCFFGVMPACADGVVSEARLTAPTMTAAVVAWACATPDWAALAVPVSTAAPPIPTASPPRTTVLLI